MSKLDEIKNKVLGLGAALKHEEPEDTEEELQESASPMDELELDHEEPERSGLGSLVSAIGTRRREDGTVRRRGFASNLEPQQKLKAIYIAGVAMIAVVCLIALVYAVLFSQDARFERELERGQQYLANNQYKQAVESYSVVVKIDETYTDGYMNRAEAYAGLNDYVNAQKDYEKVIELDSANYDAYLALAQVMVAQSRTDDAIRVLQNGYNETKYAQIYDMLYELKSKSGSTLVSGNVNYTSNGIAAEGAESAKITIYDRDLQRDLAISYTDASGAYSMKTIAGNYTLSVEAEGCLPFSYDFTIEDGQTLVMDRVLLIDEQEAQGNGTVQIAMSDASTGTFKAGVSVNLRSGWDKTEGEYVREAPVLTNDNGVAILNSVPSGYYTLEYSCDGYITAIENVAISTGATIYLNDCICPVMAENEGRIVLTWGAGVTDLDLNVIGYGDTEDDIHVYFGETSYNDGNTVRLLLNCKNSSGYGPETVQILGGVYGEGYTIYVFDYDNRSQEDSDKMSNCGATVRLYVGDSLVGTVNIPVGNSGTYWYACTISPDWTITPIHRFTNSAE